MGIGETCVTRRDVRYRGYPYRNGAYSTALEICADAPEDTTCAAGTTSTTAQKFFTSFLGNSDYAKDLADGHTQAIYDEYSLNGRYRRAYMINPGYEWTPTQTGGASIFSVSQKLFMFALITLDEGVSSAEGEPMPQSNYPNRRRMLLSSAEDALKDGQSGLGGTTIEFKTSPAQMLASAYGVPTEKVATYTVKMQLTANEACLADVTPAESVRASLADMVKDVASKHETVQILTMKVDKAGGKTGVVSVTPLDVSPKVRSAPADYVSDATYDTNEESSVNVGLIVGIVVGVVAAIAVLAISVFFFMKRSEPQPICAVTTINVDDLKSQLAAEV